MNNQSIFYFTVFMLIISPGCAKLCGFLSSWISWVLCYRAVVHSWVRNFFSWVFHGSKIFSRGYFSGPIFFLWLFCGSKYFTHGYFVDLSFFVVGNPWIQFFFSRIFWGSKFLKLSVNFSDKQNEAYGWVILN